MPTRLIVITVITLAAIMWLSFSGGESATEVRAFLRALLRALF